MSRLAGSTPPGSSTCAPGSPGTMATRRPNVARWKTLVRREPGRTEAMARLAELLQQAGDAAGAVELRRRKADLDAALDRYIRLYKEDRYPENLAELAGLADRLGRRFEARGFRALARLRDPSNPSEGSAPTRLDDAAAPEPPASASLADVIGAGATPDRPSSARPSVDPRQARRGPIPWFEDEAPASGLDGFIQENGGSPIHQLPEMASGGVGLLDYDGDGFLDVYCVQGGSSRPAPRIPPTWRAMPCRATGCIAIAATGPSRTSRCERASAPCPAATGTASP